MFFTRLNSQNSTMPLDDQTKSGFIYEIIWLLPSFAVAMVVFLIFRRQNIEGDGGLFLICAKKAWELPFAISNFRCGAHDFSIFSIGLLGLTYRSFLEDLDALRVLQLILFISSIWSFFKLLKLIFREIRNPEAALLTFTFSITPVYLAYYVGISLDFIALPFLLLYLRAIISSNYLLAGIFGAGFALSKETTLFAYLISLPFVLWFPLRHRVHSLKSGLFNRCLRISPLFLGVICYGMLLLTETRSINNVSSELGLCGKSVLGFFLSSNLWDSDIQAYFFDLFVLNFQWVLSILLLTGGAIQLYRGYSNKVMSPLTKIDPAGLGLIVIFFVVWIYVFTRCPLWNNTKYILIALPLFLILSFWASFCVFTSTTRRMIFFLIVCLLYIGSLFWTIDPVSTRYFGTFEWGEKTMLCMNSRSQRKTPNSCGHDELYYSLQRFIP